MLHYSMYTIAYQMMMQMLRVQKQQNKQKIKFMKIQKKPGYHRMDVRVFLLYYSYRTCS